MSQRYHPVSVACHWLTVIGIAAATVMASIMVDIPGITPQKLKLFNYHKWLGVCLLALVLVRILFRIAFAAPALPGSIPVWQQRAATLLHLGLYALMLAIPLLGYFYSLASGYPVVLFGVFPLPVLMGPDPELKPVLKLAHQAANWLLWSLLAVHIAAALKHAFIDRDGVFGRMWPRWLQKSGTAAAPLAAMAALLLTYTPSSQATTIDASASQVSATFKQLGVPVTGTFRKVAGDVSFDSAKPAQAKAQLDIEVASFDLGDKDYNAEVAKKDWFDARQFPKAQFVIGRVVAQGAGFQVEGTLKIKGRSQSVQFPASVRRQGALQVFEGRVPVSRLAFSIGEGEWKDTALVADEVLIQFRIAVPVAP